MINHNAQKSSDKSYTLYDVSYIINHVMYFGLKARIHCEIYLSDYFMKHNLTYISLHLI